MSCKKELLTEYSFVFIILRSKTSLMNLSENLLVFYHKWCPLFGYATHYLFYR